MSLGGKVCIVTGASRGIGKGIAIQLAEKGAKVYITGRSLDTQKEGLVGSLRDTAAEAESRGGHCIAVQCDHTKDSDIERLFDQVNRENDGQLDILVNNAYSAVHAISGQMRVKFWDQPVSMWDTVNNVGLRNHYICAVHAAKMMVPKRNGLIVNISSGGGLRYMFTPAYGIGKEAVDRMAADCGHELRRHNVAFVSLWPGPVGTENVLTLLGEALNKPIPEGDDMPIRHATPREQYDLFAHGETPEFSGQCIAALSNDPNIMKKSGKILMTADLGREYALKDKEGHTPVDFLQIKVLLYHSGYQRLSAWIPSCLRIPKWLMVTSASKFY